MGQACSTGGRVSPLLVTGGWRLKGCSPETSCAGSHEADASCGGGCVLGRGGCGGGACDGAHCSAAGGDVTTPPAPAVTDLYEIKGIIGAGAYAVTRLCVHKASGRHYAIKTMRKASLGADERRRARREVQVMEHLKGHPSVVSLEGAYEDAKWVHIVMELAPGGDLADRIRRKGRYPEAAAAALVRSVLGALAYAHDMGVVHRDIKVDNLLLGDATPEAPAKLGDWGYAAFAPPGGPRRLHKLCGTVYYLAPEMLARGGPGYDEKVDVWATGVVLYALLSGRLPFNGATPDEVMDAIRSPRRGTPDLSAAPWPSISAAAKAAVSAMLTRDPAARPSARDMLAHPWVLAQGAPAATPAAAAGAGLACGGGCAAQAPCGAGTVPEGATTEPEVLHRLGAFASMARLKQAAALAIARRLGPDQAAGLRALFEAIDADHSGAITAGELRKALQLRAGAAGLPQGASAGALEELLGAADVRHVGAALDWPEFAAAELHPCRLAEDANLRYAFEHLDTDHDGRVTPSDLAAALAADGDGPLAPAEAAAAIAAVDEDGDGAVDFVEFAHMMRRRESDDNLASGCSAQTTGAGGVGAGGDDDDCGYYDLY